MATTHIDVKGQPVEVLLVGHASAYVAGELAQQGRYYLSPTIANVAFEDREQDRKVTPVFEGRSYDEMLAYLVKNAK